jgi:hypothetical protein
LILPELNTEYKYCGSFVHIKVTHGVPQGPMLLPFYINGLPQAVNNNSKPVLFADDTSVIASNPDLVNFKNDLTFSFEQLNAWYNATGCTPPTLRWQFIIIIIHSFIHSCSIILCVQIFVTLTNSTSLFHTGFMEG